MIRVSLAWTDKTEMTSLKNKPMEQKETKKKQEKKENNNK